MAMSAEVTKSESYKLIGTTILIQNQEGRARIRKQLWEIFERPFGEVARRQVPRRSCYGDVDA